MSDTPTAQAPFLTAWFGILDGDDPSGILDLISADFAFSILFSTGGDGATDFHGGRPALERYLDQRERGTRTHHLVAAFSQGLDEVFVGETRWAGEFEAGFVAAGRLDGTGRLSRLLVGRSPAVAFR